jgi:hypothetical protein
VRAHHRISGRVRIDLPADGYEMEVLHPRPGEGRFPKAVRVIVSEAEFNELREQILDADPVRAELKTAIDDTARHLGVALDDVSVGRSKWDATNVYRVVRAAERVVKERDELRERDEQLRKALLGPIVLHTTTAEHTWTPTDETSAQLVDELRAVIVSQAREIARLKGESE